MSKLKDKYTVKPVRISEPEVYLGGDIGEFYYPGVSYAWTIS